MSRRGFTLVELLVAITVLAIVGVGLTRLLAGSTRFVTRQDATLTATQGARAALNAIAGELQMVGDSGLIAATPDGQSVTVRLPYAFGVTCRHASSQSFVASLLPVDSAAYAAAVAGGFAWRRPTGVYANVVADITTGPSTDAAKCDADSVRIVPGGRRVLISGYPAAQAPDSLALLTLFQVVTYRFGSSSDLPGRVALWRKAGSGADEELAAPFDSAAGFGFLVGGPNAATMVLENTPPADLNGVRGLELRLFAQSVSAPQGAVGPRVFPLRARVMFANKAS